jgi:nucleoside-diphosphate-sugar epimerase
MSKHIVVAGSNGDLGQRIVKALVKDGARVTALVRVGGGTEKNDAVAALGAEPVAVDMSKVDEIAAACAGADCVVSARAGLRDVILDAQKLVLDGAVKAGVPRFIPSDFCTDYTDLTPGENRNFDLRRDFHKILVEAPIASTAIFCGCFSEVLAWSVPVLNFKKKTVGYWGDPDHRIDFTSMDDTAAFTAAAALDAQSPKVLHIASFQASANDFVAFTAKVLGTPYELVNMGSVEDLRQQNKAARAAHPEGENELYAKWQQSQYMQSMFSATHPKLDNTRYPEIAWTSMAEAIHLRS